MFARLISDFWNLPSSCQIMKIRKCRSHTDPLANQVPHIQKLWTPLLLGEWHEENIFISSPRVPKTFPVCSDCYQRPGCMFRQAGVWVLATDHPSVSPLSNPGSTTPRAKCPNLFWHNQNVRIEPFA